MLRAFPCPAISPTPAAFATNRWPNSHGFPFAVRAWKNPARWRPNISALRAARRFKTNIRWTSNGRCGLCRLGLNGYDAAYSFGPYDGTLRQLVHLFKYSRIQTSGPATFGLPAAALPREQRFDAIVPMPMHWRRKWRRGFNQAELLARRLSVRTRIPMLEPLRRRRLVEAPGGTEPRAAPRRTWPVFSYRREKNSLRNLRVLLVDDVLTTGATASACSAALKRCRSPARQRPDAGARRPPRPGCRRRRPGIFDAMQGASWYEQR